MFKSGVVANVNKTVVILTPVVTVSKFMIWPWPWEIDFNWEKTWLHTTKQNGLWWTEWSLMIVQASNYKHLKENILPVMIHESRHIYNWYDSACKYPFYQRKCPFFFKSLFRISRYLYSFHYFDRILIWLVYP